MGNSKEKGLIDLRMPLIKKNPKPSPVETPDEWANFKATFHKLQRKTYITAIAHGFQSYQANELYVPTKLALIMSEASEALEAHRQGKDSDIGHELADIVIRTMDLAESLHIDLADAIVEKAKFNENRPFKHGNKRY